ncbi:hypothetical protein Psch_03172 [Pelotomaculum schinkii]|uniref:Uncharacterized protein n=1 Tax=Pelotomaculum schinkii TaxID=78350 RepID=A0A4Y7RBN9_9FIRM|nr:hypothetical protein [Pelotomaculum schinkii]TEB06130.1 hypothetical protein Psch_03172 [Pelotomaculum schinkii]
MICGGCAGSGAPPANKNALKTGEHEAIWKDMLDEDELDLYEQIETDPLAQIVDTIRLLSLRERRMVQRIQKLKEGLTRSRKGFSRNVKLPRKPTRVTMKRPAV